MCYIYLLFFLLFRYFWDKLGYWHNWHNTLLALTSTAFTYVAILMVSHFKYLILGKHLLQLDYILFASSQLQTTQPELCPNLLNNRSSDVTGSAKRYWAEGKMEFAQISHWKLPVKPYNSKALSFRPCSLKNFIMIKWLQPGLCCFRVFYGTSNVKLVQKLNRIVQFGPVFS